MSRDASQWPFASDDPFNIGIGNGAEWSKAGSDLTLAIQADGTGNINGGQQNPSYSIPVYVAAASDPKQSISGSDIYIPNGALPAGGSDHHITCIQPYTDGTYSCYGMYGAAVTGNAAPNGYTASYQGGPFDLHGHSSNYDGRATSIMQIAGLIRVSDIAQEGIFHAIAMALPASSLTPDPLWPATTQDGGDGGEYTGPPDAAHPGQCVGIPSTVDLSSLGLTAAGLMLATALQTYGAFVVDTGSNLALYAEDQYDESIDTATFDAALGNMRSDMPTIIGVLAGLTNQQTGQTALTADRGLGSGSTGSLAAAAPNFAQAPTTVTATINDADGTCAYTYGTEWSSVNSSSYDAYVGVDAGNSMSTVLWFPKVPVPAGVSITSASLTWQNYPADNSEVNVVGALYGVAADDPTAFTSYNDYTSAVRTSASTPFNGVPNYGSNTIDATAMVTEIVGRPGWNRDNSMILLGQNNDSPNYQSFGVVAYSGYGSLPVLSITYTYEPTPSGATTPDSSGSLLLG